MIIFEFGISEEGIKVYPKQQGILRLSRFNDFSLITDKLLDETEIITSTLPQNKIQSTKRQGIAIGIKFANPTRYSQSLSLTPLKGNLNAQQELSSKITVIEPGDYLQEKEQYSIKEQDVLEDSFSLTDEALSYKSNSTDIYGADKIIIKTLKKLLPKLKGTPLYLLKNDYKISKRDLTPITIHLEHPEISFKLLEEDAFFLLESYITINGKKSKLTTQKKEDNFLILKIKDNYFLVKSLSDAKTIFFFRQNPKLRFPKTDYDNYYTKLIQPLSEKYTVEIKGLKQKKEKSR